MKFGKLATLFTAILICLMPFVGTFQANAAAAPPRVDVGIYPEVIAPNAFVNVVAFPSSVTQGDPVSLVVTETNTGNVDLTSPEVDLNVLPFILNNHSANFGGDTLSDGILGTGETWTWQVNGLVLLSSTLITATGHGFDPLFNDVTFPTYLSQQSKFPVLVNPPPPPTVTPTIIPTPTPGPTPVGMITQLDGSVQITRADGTQIEAKVGYSVFQGDIIETSKTGGVVIQFVDNMTFAIAESARMSVDQFVYNSAEHSGSAFFSWLQGVFVYTSGLIGKSDPNSIHIETAVGSLGSRGTEFIFRYDPSTGIGRVDLILGSLAITPTLANTTTVFDAPKTIVFDSTHIISVEPLSQESYDLEKDQILAPLRNSVPGVSLWGSVLLALLFGGAGAGVIIRRTAARRKAGRST